MSYGKDQVYDVDPEFKKLFDLKQAMRTETKERYLRLITSPYRHRSGDKIIFDPAVYRFLATRGKFEGYYKPQARGTLYFHCMFTFPVLVFTFAAITMRRDYDARCRSGLVSYNDRSVI